MPKPTSNAYNQYAGFGGTPEPVISNRIKRVTNAMTMKHTPSHNNGRKRRASGLCQLAGFSGDRFTGCDPVTPKTPKE